VKALHPLLMPTHKLANRDAKPLSRSRATGRPWVPGAILGQWIEMLFLDGVVVLLASRCVIVAKSQCPRAAARLGIPAQSAILKHGRGVVLRSCYRTWAPRFDTSLRQRLDALAFDDVE
jgi:hypothetical protein